MVGQLILKQSLDQGLQYSEKKGKLEKYLPWLPDGGQHVAYCVPSLMALGGEAGEEGVEERREQGQEGDSGVHQAGQGCS